MDQQWFTMTERIDNAIERVLNNDKAAANDALKQCHEAYVRVCKSNDEQATKRQKVLVSLANVKYLSDRLRESSAEENTYYIHELLKGSEFVPEKLPRKPIDLALRAKLNEARALAANKEYARMVKNVSSQRSDEKGSARREWRSLGSQFAIGVNILVSMATFMAIGFYLTRYMFGTPASGIIGGVIFMIVGLIIEGVLVAASGFELDSFLHKRERTQQQQLHRPLAFPSPSAPIDQIKRARRRQRPQMKLD
jgi:Endoplasmic reticulum-based factor for assembly of V-ATPase